MRRGILRLPSLRRIRLGRLRYLSGEPVHSPWYDGDMLGASNIRLISPLIRRELLKDPEVEAVLEFSVSQASRLLSIRATVRTIRGDTLSLSEVFNG